MPLGVRSGSHFFSPSPYSCEVIFLTWVGGYVYLFRGAFITGAVVEYLLVDPILWGVETEQVGVEPERVRVEPEQAGVVVEVELEWLLQVGQ